MDYLEMRQVALDVLDQLDEIQRGYARLIDEKPRNLAQRLSEYVSEQRDSLHDLLAAVQTDSALANVISSEQVLEDRHARADRFWRALVAEGAIDEFEGHGLREIQTSVPPDPPTEITGHSVMEFLLQMQHWVLNAAAELWTDGDHTLVLPNIGDRYAIGDFEQLPLIVNAFDRTRTLRHHWLQMSSLGDHWDSANVGSARSKLIHLAVDVMTDIIAPTPEGSSVLRRPS